MKKFSLIFASICFSLIFTLKGSLLDSKLSDQLDDLFFVQVQAQCDDDEREEEEDCPNEIDKETVCYGGSIDCTPVACPVAIK